MQSGLGWSGNGVFSAGTATAAAPNAYGGSYIKELKFDASRSSSIYKDSATTVVPESLITNFYIRY